MLPIPILLVLDSVSDLSPRLCKMLLKFVRPLSFPMKDSPQPMLMHNFLPVLSFLARCPLLLVELLGFSQVGHLAIGDKLGFMVDT